MTPRRESSKPPRKRKPFAYWWPITIRVTGLGIAIGHIGYATITQNPTDGSVLAFCGALIVAPNVLGAGRQ